MPVWPESVRFISHPSDPRYKGATLETRYPPPSPFAPSFPRSSGDGVHTRTMTQEQAEQVYQMSPWLIRHRLPPPVIVPVEYQPFRYEYIRLSSLLGRQRISQREADVAFHKYIVEHATVHWFERFGTPTSQPSPPKEETGLLAQLTSFTITQGFKAISYVGMPIEERMGMIMHQFTGDMPSGKDTEVVLKKFIDREFRFQKDLVKQNERTYASILSRGDVVGAGLRFGRSPPVLVSAFYAMGTVMGYFAGTAVGQKTLFSIGIFEKTLGTGQYIYNIAVTPSGIAQASVGGYFGYELGKGGIEAYRGGKLGEFALGLGIMLPFAHTAYKSGYYKGMGVAQRTSAISKLSDPLARTRQQAVYEAGDIVSKKLREPYLKGGTLNLLHDVQKMDQYATSSYGQYLKTVRGRHLSRMGGSSAMRMQMGEFFRYGDMPKALQKYTKGVQFEAWMSGLQKGSGVKGLIGKKLPVDIDILVMKTFGSLKHAKQSLLGTGIHIHGYKPGRYYSMGWQELYSVKGKIIDPLSNISKSIKTLSVREQFIRYSASILPSEQQITGYRAYKDIPGWFETGDVLSFQAGGGKLRTVMDKFIHPEKYPSPKVTVGEKFIRIMGGAAQPKDWVETYGGSFIQPVYPKGMYYKPYVGLLSIGLYPPIDYKSPKISYKTIIPSQYPFMVKIQRDMIPSYYREKIPTTVPPVFPKMPIYPTLPLYPSPPYAPPPYIPPTPYPPDVPPPPPPPKTFDIPTVRRRAREFELLDVPLKYRFRKFKLPSLKEMGL